MKIVVKIRFHENFQQINNNNNNLLLLLIFSFFLYLIYIDNIHYVENLL